MPNAAAPSRFVCTAISHAVSKSSRHRFERDTEPRGLMPDGDGGFLRLGNCRHCGTTLSLVADEAEIRRERDAGRL